MKHKFSSMGRVAIALVLALSLSLVMTVPVSAGDPTVAIVAGGGIDDLTGAPTGSGTEAGEHSITVTDATASILTGAVAENATTEDTMLNALAGTEVLTVTIAGEEVTTDVLAEAEAGVTTLAAVATDIETKINAATTIADVTVFATDTGGVSNDYFVITVDLAGVNNSITSEVTGTGATPTGLAGQTPAAGTDADAVDTFTADTGSNGLWQADPSYGNESATMTIAHSPDAGTASSLTGLEALVTAADAFIEGVTLTSLGGLEDGTATVTVTNGGASYLVVTGDASMIAGGTNELTVTAFDSADNQAITYVGEKTLTFSGPSVAPDGTVPTVEGIQIGEGQTVSFTLGVADGANLTLIAYVAEATTVDVSDGTVDSFADPAYDLDLFVEGTSLDKAFYMIGDDVAVTVCDANANLDPIRTDKVDVQVTSTTDSVGITVTLSETGGVNTGIFTGTFPLVAADPEPGPGELAVADGDIIDVDAADVPDATATVDMTGPEFAADTTADAPFYNNGDTITLTVTLDEADLTVTADFSEIDSEYTVGVEAVTGGPIYTVTYTIAEANTTLDGEYTIPVAAEDAAGNAADDAGFTTSVLVGLDKTEPSVTLPTADPVVIQPAPATTDVTFTASVSDGEGSGVDTVTVDLDSIGGIAGQLMDEGDPGVYTFTLEDVSVAEATYELVITATDALGNVNDTVAITLRVVLDVTGPEITSTSVEYPVGYESARVGDDVIITAVVSDDLAGVDTVTIDATAINLTGAEDLALTDENTYIATLEVQTGTTVGTKTLTITATDYAGNPSDIEVTVEVTLRLTAYNIDLVEDWNLTSLPLIPTDESIDVVLADISDNVIIVWYYYNNGPEDQGWLYYAPGVAESTLTSMEDGKGYWVNMSSSANLTISGREMPLPPELPPTYPVAFGWNLIGFKSVDALDHDVYLGNLVQASGVLVIMDYSVLWGYDPAEGYFNVYPMNEHCAGGFDDTIGDMEVGHGYWLWVKTMMGIIVPPR